MFTSLVHDSVSDGENLQESTFEQEENPRYSRAAGSDDFMQVKDPMAAAAAAAVAASTTESEYLQIGDEEDGGDSILMVRAEATITPMNALIKERKRDKQGSGE